MNATDAAAEAARYAVYAANAVLADNAVAACAYAADAAAYAADACAADATEKEQS
jgi:hypothetical protein